MKNGSLDLNSIFFSVVQRHASASGLFLQAVCSRGESNVSTSHQLLAILEHLHSSQSAAALVLVVEKLVASKQLVLARKCDAVARKLVTQLLSVDSDVRTGNCCELQLLFITLLIFFSDISRSSIRRRSTQVPPTNTQIQT